MNCTNLFYQTARLKAKKSAIVTADGRSINFLQLAELAGGLQRELISLGLRGGDKVLLFASPTIELYACSLALLGLGIPILLVEPWMPLAHIENVVRENQPKAFITNALGMLFGTRVKAIRAIPIWTRLSALAKKIRPKNFIVEDLDEQVSGIITFTTGTTGYPKGVVRSQGYLVNQHDVLTKSLSLHNNDDCDLTIFANFVFSNLARGATSLLMPSRWSKNNCAKIARLAHTQKPKTITCGPAFLLQAMRSFSFVDFKHVHVGGALTDCAIFDQAFKTWPQAHFLHVYGSSEAEPVACVDAHVAVSKSRAAGFFQTLYLGKAVNEARLTFDKDALWVSGRHVCPKYVGAETDNQLYKKIDDQGILWHHMGDRITTDNNGLWYGGRSSQPHDDFLLEQKLYTTMHSSKSFVKRIDDRNLMWLGENIAEMKKITLGHKTINQVVKTKIVRDRRHRARIDRMKSTPKHLV